MNLAQHCIWGTKSLNDQNRAFWGLSELAREINEAVRKVQDLTKLAKTCASFSTVANKFSYSLPDQILDVERDGIIFDEGKYNITPSYVENAELRQNIMSAGTYPTVYTVRENLRTVEFWQATSTAAPASTLGGSLSATATSVTVADTSDFPDWGRALITTANANEVISWTAKTATTLTGLSRGLEGTAPVAHSSSDVITWRNVSVYGTRRLGVWEMRNYYSIGTATTTANSAAVTGGGSAAWNTGLVLPGDEFGTMASYSDVTETDPVQFIPISLVTGAQALTLSGAWIYPAATAQSYIISSPSPLPAECDKAIHFWLMAQSCFKDWNDKWGLHRTLMQNFDAEITSLKQGLNKMNRPAIMRGYHDGGSGPRRKGLISPWLP